MNSERASAYGRLMKTIDDMGPAKLLDDEVMTIREAADTVLFTEDPAVTRDAVASVARLANNLVESGRWIEESAEGLVRDVEDCGPEAALA
jgi:hypothetical protein